MKITGTHIARGCLLAAILVSVLAFNWQVVILLGVIAGYEWGILAGGKRR